MNKVIIKGTDSKTYLGEISDATKEVIVKGQPCIVELLNAWEFISIDQHIGNPQTGELVGYTRKHMVMPVGAAEDAKAEGFHVSVSCWWWPDEEEEKIIEKMVAQAQDATVQKKAAKSGIVRAGPGALAGLRNAAVGKQNNH